MIRIAAKKNLILACHFTGIYDVNRNHILAHDSYELVSQWADSIINLGLQGIIFHNNFSKLTCQKYSNNNISFVEVDYNPTFNPNVFRYFIYKQFLAENIDHINSVFVTDITDVVVLQNPFIQPSFVNTPKLFCGDEPKRLDNDWMKDHATHLRNNIKDYQAYEIQFAKAALLNCGIIGAEAQLLKEFFERLWYIHEHFNKENKTAYTGDMGAFNYLVRTQYNKRICFGAPVNTLFKQYEVNRKDCWFRHK
jgi:hypothetical protein